MRPPGQSISANLLDSLHVSVYPRFDAHTIYGMKVRLTPGGRICAVAGKRKYPTRVVAESQLKRLRRIRKSGERLECRAYLCPVCVEFHLTAEM